WMQPGTQPVTSKGKCTNKMIMGGRYQESNFSGDFMGSKMEGRNTLAYDNAKKKFQSSWIDNMGTGMMEMEGTWDDASKTINLSDTMLDPMTSKETPVRETMQIIDDKNHAMHMFVT